MTLKFKMSKKIYSAQAPTGFLGAPGQSIQDTAKPETAVPHNGISYAEVKKECLKQGELFEDPDFDAVDTNLFFSKKAPVEFQWKRPQEIVAKPYLFVGGASRFDIAQGMLGDCWLLAAVAALCQNQSLLHQVIPPDQFFDKEYCGVFRFRFWQYGRWEEVLVDDRLPTRNNRLVFLHSTEGNEFWSALLEKAYAKLCGSYEALKGGQTCEAMEDFTGGVTETFDLKQLPANFFKIMLKAVDRQSLMCCAIDAKPGEIEAKLDNGLVKGHAYTMTAVKQVKTKENKEYNLVRIRNPWGNEREWTGAWCDGSEEWKQLTEGEKKAIGLSYDDDGEFWMDFNDFISQFSKLEICMLSPDSAGDSTAKRWEMQINQGSWQKHLTAGGCRNFIDTFHLNPQFRITLEDPDQDNDVEDNCTVIFGLIQKGRRKIKRLGAQNLTIGFSIYRLEDDANDYMEDGRLSKDFFLHHKSHARSYNFVNLREIIGRFSFPPGDYVIVPSTYKANEEGDFVMRMFSEQPQKQTCMDTQTESEIQVKTMTKEDKEEIDEKLKGFFDKVAGDDGEIDAFELHEVVKAALRKEITGDISLEASRSLLAMMDRDRSGKLDYEEFQKLWKQLMSWKKNFLEYDRDGSGDMSAVELRGAMSHLGFKLSTPALSSITLRYANKHGNVKLDDYIQICCRVQTCFESYSAYHGKSFSLDEGNTESHSPNKDETKCYEYKPNKIFSNIVEKSTGNIHPTF